jgi:hypothetical protein
MALHSRCPMTAPAFDDEGVTCPCGGTDWHRIRGKGIFCADCNCRARVSRLSDPEAEVTFDTSTCWSEA